MKVYLAGNFHEVLLFAVRAWVGEEEGDGSLVDMGNGTGASGAGM